MSGEWANSPCRYGCDCGDCYSRCPDEGPCHCANEAAIREYEHRQHQAARDYVRSSMGLPLDKYVCPECDPT